MDEHFDQHIYSDGQQSIVWAIGQLNSRDEVSYHSTHSYGNKYIDFARTPVWNCPRPDQSLMNQRKWQQLTAAAATNLQQAKPTRRYPSPPKRNATRPLPENNPEEISPTTDMPITLEPIVLLANNTKIEKSKAWKIPKIVCPKDRNLWAQIGPVGGQKRGYSGITGRQGWGVAWYINGLLIPELVLQRGVTYTFLVEGGNEENNPTRRHPMYLTSSDEGGFEFKSPAERRKERVFGGVGVTANGTIMPTAEGRLCEWKSTPATRLQDIDGTYESFEDFQSTLLLDCENGGQPGVIRFTPDHKTPNLLYYQCYSHRYLGWKIHVVDNCEDHEHKPNEEHSLHSASSVVNIVKMEPPEAHQINPTLDTTNESPVEYYEVKEIIAVPEYHHDMKPIKKNKMYPKVRHPVIFPSTGQNPQSIPPRPRRYYNRHNHPMRPNAVGYYPNPYAAPFPVAAQSHHSHQPPTQLAHSQSQLQPKIIPIPIPVPYSENVANQPGYPLPVQTHQSFPPSSIYTKPFQIYTYPDKVFQSASFSSQNGYQLIPVLAEEYPISAVKYGPQQDKVSQTPPSPPPPPPPPPAASATSPHPVNSFNILSEKKDSPMIGPKLPPKLITKHPDKVVAQRISLQSGFLPVISYESNGVGTRNQTVWFPASFAEFKTRRKAAAAAAAAAAEAETSRTKMPNDLYRLDSVKQTDSPSSTTSTTSTTTAAPSTTEQTTTTASTEPSTTELFFGFDSSLTTLTPLTMSTTSESESTGNNQHHNYNHHNHNHHQSRPNDDLSGNETNNRTTNEADNAETLRHSSYSINDLDFVS